MTTKNISNTADNSNEEIDLLRIFGIIMDAKILIIIVTFLFLIFGIAFALLSTPIYKADALIQIEQKSSGGISAMVGDMGDVFASESSSNTEIELIKSRMILGDTVDNFNLTTVVSYEYLPIIGRGLARLTDDERFLNVSTFEFPNVYNSDEHKIIIESVKDRTSFKLFRDDKEVLTGDVGQSYSKDGYRIFVSSVKAKPGDVFYISKRSKLDAIAFLNSNLSIEEKGKNTGIISLTLTGEDKELIAAILDDISRRYFLQNVERNAEEAEKSLEFLKGHLPEVKSKLTQSEDVLNDFRQDNDSIDLGLEAKSTLDIMVRLETQLNELTFKESEISQKYTKDHPYYKSLLDKRQVLLGEREKLNKQVQKLPKTQREILRYTRDVQVNQQIYVQLLNKVQELNIIKASTVGNVRIIDGAESYSRPIKPNKAVIVILFTIIGGILAVAFVVVKAALHKGVENPDDIESLGLSVYASVPKSHLQVELAGKLKRKNKNKANAEMLLLAQSNPADLSIEALRGLRTSLHFAMMEAKNNVLMFSGPAPGIGKSFVSTNFAAVAAKTGQKVLLIDADMRKGYLQQCFGVEWDNGLSDILSGKLSIEDGIKSTGIENLNIITRGQVPPNPSELLMHPRFSELVEWANDNYDLVIIDTPPVLAVTDPSIVGAIAGTTLMVARFGLNTVKEIDVARSRFAQSGIDVKGVILNAVEKKASNAYGYGYYSYSYEADK
ncbi:polysaccharide biosynthesis tyrosine autokinase [Vibrio fluvialis]|nr:polysaccharide biosynthesis tyrosine autokinase [Vibrio fluvialis]